MQVFGPSGYGSATLRCKISSLPFLGLRQGGDQALPSGNLGSDATCGTRLLGSRKVICFHIFQLESAINNPSGILDKVLAKKIIMDEILVTVVKVRHSNRADRQLRASEEYVCQVQANTAVCRR